jgi:bla regulator protein blaR1
MIHRALVWWVEQCPPRLGAIAGASAKATLLLALAAVASLAWRRRPASARHLVWCLAVAGALAIAPLSLMLPAWRLPVVQAGSIRGAAGPGGALAPWLSWDRAVVALWLAGVLVVLGRLLAARARISAFARGAAPVSDWRAGLMGELVAGCGIARAVALFESAEVGLPMTWGVRRPAIALPVESRAWTRAGLEAALAHELAHVRRLDALTQLVAQVACAVYWFHPLAWLAALQMRVLREFACDDEVLANGTRPSQYAQEVLAIVRGLEEKQDLGLATAGMARVSELKVRLLAVLNPRLARARLTRGQVLAPGAVVSGLVVALSMMRPAAAAHGADVSGTPGRPRPIVATPVAAKAAAPVAAPRSPERASRAVKAPPARETRTARAPARSSGTCNTPRRRRAR